jgi:threonylcarbamoyladenosine tRNA methylthiotransferase MtaB
MDNHIQGDVKKERVRTLINLGENKLIEFSKNMVGQESDVLFERAKDGYFEGYTSNYIKVRAKSEEKLQNQIRRMKFTEFKSGKLNGEFL